MNNEQNRFYTSISKYYSEIFPYKAMQLQFVKNNTGNINGSQILDIGCATGELAFNLAENGAAVTGIDLNEELLLQAKNSKVHPGLRFQKGDMLELKKDFGPNVFDTALCFGNTLVHLTEKELIGKMLKGVFSVLKPGGVFLLQILNYDYILEKQISVLPLIETENIKFERSYEFADNSSIVRFKTGLQLKNEGRVVSNQTSLLALQSAELVKLLEEAEFGNIGLFSNFKGETAGGNHLPLVVAATKL